MLNRIINKFYLIIGRENTNKVKRFMVDRNKKIKSEISKNQKFYNIHKGERCFIIGNGPSAKNIDFKKLANEYTFTVNQFSRFDNFENLKTNYHVFADERIFKLDENKEVDREALTYLKKLISSSDSIQFFSKISSKDYIETSSYFEGIRVNYYQDELTFHENYNLDFDITKQIPWFPTVIDYCIFIAMYMGFTEIYLLGCDCTGFLKISTLLDEYSNNFSYGYNITNNEAERIKNQLKTYGVAEELEIWGRIFRYYEYLEDFSKKNGVRITNCTEKSLLFTFQTNSLEEVLKN